MIIDSNQSIILPTSIGIQKGVIVQGQVLKLMTGSLAEIKLTSQTYHAVLETPLEIGKSYWFQIQELQPHLILKVLQRDSSGEKGRSSLPNLLKSLGLSNTHQNQVTLEQFIKNQIPVSKTLISQVSKWCENVNINSGVEAIKWMMERQFPLEESFFRAGLARLEKGATLPLLKEIHDLLQPYISNNKGLLQLTEQINHLFSQIDSSLKAMPTNQLLTLLGLDLERLIKQHMVSKFPIIPEAAHSIKSLLLQAQTGNNLPHNLKELISKGIDHLTAQGLELLKQQGPLLQITLHLPYMQQGQAKEVEVTLEGKREEGAPLDSNNCRIIVRLDLEKLKEITVLIQVQSRRVSIQVHNQQGFPLESLISKFLPVLRDNLEQHHYKLLGVKQVAIPLSPLTLNRSTNRWDVRV